MFSYIFPPSKAFIIYKKFSHTMKKSFLFSLVFFAATSLFAQTKWTVDKAHSKLQFTVTHLGISDVSGVLRNFDATVVASKPDFSDAVFQMTAELASIDTEVEMRDNHLKSPDFFDVAKYPRLSFTSSTIRKTGKDRYQLAGNLTMHGVTKPVTMELWFRGTVTNPMSKLPTSGFQLTGTLKRSDFQVGNTFPAPMISDEVVIKADGEFAQQK